MNAVLRLACRTRHSQAALFAAAGCFIALQVWLSLKIPDAMETITRLVKTPGSSSAAIWHSGAQMLFFALACAAAGIAAGWFAVHAGAAYSRDLRAEIYSKVESFSMKEMDTFSTASLITRSTNDVAQIQNFLAKGMQDFIRAPFMALWALVKISGRHWQWTALTACSIAAMSAVIVFMVFYAHPRLRRRQKYTDEISRILRENMTGVRVIRAYGVEEAQQKKFDRANKILTDSERKAHHAMSFMRPTVRFMNNALMVGIYLTGASIIAASPSQDRIGIFADMVVYSSYTAILIRAFMSLNMALNQYPRAAASGERIMEVLDTAPETASVPEVGTPAEQGTLEFQNVSFRYPGASDDALCGISFTLKPGTVTAVIGATGSGKSTLVRLIPRLYEPLAGRILIDGEDIRAMTLFRLHSLIGYAAQTAILLKGTVRSNTAYGDNGRKRGDEEIRDALETAQAADFTSAMGGLDAAVSRGGSSLSGGQKQRLSIARAVCWKPEIFLLDDTFSALDFKTDRALRTALKREKATMLIVAQRISTIMDADQILVMDRGRIVDRGTHQELMKRCRIYSEIAESQLYGKETADVEKQL
jgi:ATP-binding cassette subfamily B multidrug efflux pump